MKDKKSEIKNFYLEISKDENKLNYLRNKLISISGFNCEFINTYLIPLAKEMSFDFSVDDIIDYESEKLNYKKMLNKNELSEIAGGKFADKFASLSLLTIIGLSGVLNSDASAEFIYFGKTKEANSINSGDLELYLQADHLVDGILWFKKSDSQKVFFILNRRIDKSSKKIEYTCSYHTDIQEFENKLLDMDELPGKLKISCMKALRDTPTKPATLSIIDDNPLYSFARFYNPNFKFDKNPERKNLKDIPMYKSENEIKLESIAANRAVTLMSNLKETISWKMVHRLTSREKPNFTTIESARVLTKHYDATPAHTSEDDEKVLCNDGFTFFTLQPKVGVHTLPDMFKNEKILQEAVIDFKEFPLVSCSKDMLPRIHPEVDNMFYTDGDDLGPVFPCFNGSSEDVKNQIIKYYLGEKLSTDGNCLSKTDEQIVNEIINEIHEDKLEIRIPTKVSIKSWETVQFD
ncbi:hypothetical protein FACS189465_1510 [Clostridia bacterium]|nr:hypothetical protein FACS189465_1510 [Clostridia bacterium]